MTNQSMTTTLFSAFPSPFTRDRWTSRQAVLPLLLAIPAEVALMLAMSPFFLKLLLAQVPVEQQAAVVNGNPLLVLSVLEAAAVPLLASVTYAGIATMVILAMTLDQRVPVRFGSLLACASWAYLPFVAKHAMQYAIVRRDGVDAVNTVLDLQPATSFGALIGEPASPWYHIADLINPFDALHLVVFVVLMTRFAGSRTPAAATAAIVAWLSVATMRIAYMLVLG